MLTPLTAISPIDGRYYNKTQELSEFFSEYGLIFHRVLVEIRFIQTLAEHSDIAECPSLTKEDNLYLENLLTNFDVKQAQLVKDIEATTNHDVKAIEYYLKEKFKYSQALMNLAEFIHFGLTSEDVNNLAYALMIKKASQNIMAAQVNDVIDLLSEMAKSNIDVAMLARTHGQSASPTTLGKEIANVVARLKRSQQQLINQQFLGKCNGAVGNFNALDFAYPDVDWQLICKDFVENKLGLTLNPYTTQIEPHDWLAELCHNMERFNTILIDLSRDFWSYISLAYFKQKTIASEVGSSTMPHKINPIDFENAEGNLGLANAMLNFFASKLPISRFQRDLTDSTVLRNIGIGFSYSLLAMKSLIKGLNKLEVNHSLISQELSKQWALLAEPIQTLMRRYGIENPYEQLKELTRGQDINQEILNDFIDTLSLPVKEIERLKQLTPNNYTGYAQALTKDI